MLGTVSSSFSSLQLYATALTIDGDNISYRPLKIGYTEGGRGGRKKKSYIDNILENVNSDLSAVRDKRSVEAELDVEGLVSYIAMEYIRFFTDNVRNTNIDKARETELLDQVKLLHQQLSSSSELGERVSRVLAAKLMTVLSR